MRATDSKAFWRSGSWLRALFAGALVLAAGAASAHQEHQAAARAPMPKAMRPALGTSVAIAADGTWHAVTKRGEHVVLLRSTDQGVSWADVAQVNREPEAISADGENRPRLAFGKDGALLVSWARAFEQRFTGDIRFARSADGKHFDPPVTVHHDRAIIGHSFNTMLMTDAGQLIVAWIDGRGRAAADRSGSDYRGSAIYTAISDDDGRSFKPEVKLADHTCQCCRLALTRDADGQPLLMWRHVFEPNERDHALARLAPDGSAASVERVTFDGWKIDACPHHGPSLAIAADGIRHAVWFNHKNGAGRVYYGRLGDGAVDGQRTVGGPRAGHADIVASDTRVAIAWKEFDGERTHLWAEISEDGGRSFVATDVASTAGAADQPRLLRHGEQLFVFWNTEHEGMKGYPLP